MGKGTKEKNIKQKRFNRITERGNDRKLLTVIKIMNTGEYKK